MFDNENFLCVFEGCDLTKLLIKTFKQENAIC